MRTAILGAVAGLGLTAGVASAHPPGWGGGWGGYAPVVVRPAPVVVAPTSGFSIGFGGWNGGFSFNSFSGGYYRPAYGWGGYPGWGGYGRYPGWGGGYGRYPGWGGYGYRPYGGYRW